MDALQSGHRNASRARRTTRWPAARGALDSREMLPPATPPDWPFGWIVAPLALGATAVGVVLIRGRPEWLLPAVWVSLSTGCTTGTCVRKTVVLDPATLLFATAMDGAVRDLAVSGDRAYVLLDQPNDIRVLDLTAVLQPAQIAATTRPASATLHSRCGCIFGTTRSATPSAPPTPWR